MDHLSATTNEDDSKVDSISSKPLLPSSVDQDNDEDYPPIFLQHEGLNKTILMYSWTLGSIVYY